MCVGRERVRERKEGVRLGEIGKRNGVRMGRERSGESGERDVRRDRGCGVGEREGVRVGGKREGV